MGQIDTLNSELKCDNPGCMISYKWSFTADPDTDQDPTNIMPDPVFRFLILGIPLTKDKWTFCSKYCLMEFLKGLEPRKSPNEIRLEQQEKARQIADVERMAGEGGND